MGPRHVDEPAMRLGNMTPAVLQRDLQQSPYSVALKRDARNRKYELQRHAQLREQVETVVIVDHLGRLAFDHGVAVDAEQHQGLRFKAVWAKAKALAVLEAVEMVAPRKAKKSAVAVSVEADLKSFLEPNPTVDAEGAEGAEEEQPAAGEAADAEAGAGAEAGAEGEDAAAAAAEGGAPAGGGDEGVEAEEDPYAAVRAWGITVAKGGKSVHTLEQVRKNVAGIEEGDKYSLYTEEAIMRRHVLRADEGVVEALERHWVLLKALIEKERAFEATKMPTPGTAREGGPSPDNTIQVVPRGSPFFRANSTTGAPGSTSSGRPRGLRVSSALYCKWNARVHMALVPFSTKMEAKVAAGREWEQEVIQAHLEGTTDKKLDKTCVLDSLFQLADMWTEGSEPMETIAFLDALLLAVAHEDGESLRALDEVTAVGGRGGDAIMPAECAKLYATYVDRKQKEMTKRNLLKRMELGDTEDTMAVMFDRERLSRKANVWERKAAQLEKFLSAGQPEGNGKLVGHPFAQGVTLVGQGKKIYSLVHKNVEDPFAETHSEAGAGGEADIAAGGEGGGEGEGEGEAGTAAEGEDGTAGEGGEAEAVPAAEEAAE